MKRIFLLVILGLLGYNEINAQFSLGASGGVNLANIKYEINYEGFETPKH